MNKISALTLRKRLGSVLDEVVEKKEAVTITRGNKPLVAIIPYEEYEKREARTTRLTEAAKRMDQLRARLAPKLRSRDFTGAVRKMREQR